MIRWILTATFLFSLNVFADYDSLLRQQRQAAAADQLNQNVQRFVDMFTRENATITSYAQRFAGAHGGFARGPEAKYNDWRENPFSVQSRQEDPAYAYVTDHGPALINKLDFATGDGFECIAAIYGVDCIHSQTGQHVSAFGLYAKKSGGKKSR